MPNGEARDARDVTERFCSESFPEDILEEVTKGISERLDEVDLRDPNWCASDKTKKVCSHLMETLEMVSYITDAFVNLKATVVELESELEDIKGELEKVKVKR